MIPILLPESLEKRIRPDNVVDLQSLLKGDPDSERDFDYLSNLTKAVLFSQYEQRKDYARRGLVFYFNPDVEVVSIEDGPITYAYLSITPERQLFLLVGRYTAPHLEEFPDADERALWE